MTDMRTQPMIVVQGLRVSRNGHAVLDVPYFSLPAGEIVALMGPNGAGKSTLLQALALLLPAEMNYRFEGRPVQLPREALALRRQMAVVFQEPLLLDASVFDNVALGLRLRGIASGDGVRERVFGWLERLGVAHLARQHARTISGGEAQRVSLARALVLEPRVLIMDEPFSSLDVFARAELLRDLGPVLKGAGVTTLFAAHEFSEILPLADRVAVVVGGRLVQEGRLQEVLGDPADPTVRKLIEAALKGGSAAFEERPGGITRKSSLPGRIIEIDGE